MTVREQIAEKWGGPWDAVERMQRALTAAES
jgi:hypothetical protein